MEATDLIVVAGAILAVLVALGGLMQLDPRVRERLGWSEMTDRRSWTIAGGALLVAAIIAFIALGGFE